MSHITNVLVKLKKIVELLFSAKTCANHDVHQCANDDSA